ADAPIDCLGVDIVSTCHPGRSAARFPVVASPGVVTWLTFAGDGEGPPQFLAGVGIVGNDVTTHAELTAGTADDHLSINNQRHQSQLLTLLVVLDCGIPGDLTGLGIERDHMVGGRAPLQVVLPQSPLTA